jgi:hypothetical protein
LGLEWPKTNIVAVCITTCNTLDPCVVVSMIRSN